jgi:hypothetical protein
MLRSEYIARSCPTLCAQSKLSWAPGLGATWERTCAISSDMTKSAGFPHAAFKTYLHSSIPSNGVESGASCQAVQLSAAETNKELVR